MDALNVFTKSANKSFGIICLLFAAAASQAMAQQITIASGSGNAVPGGTVTLGLSLASTGGALPVAVQWTISYPAAVVVSASVVAGSSATAAGKSVSCSSTVGATTCLAYGANDNVISGGVLAAATFTISASTLGSSTPIGIAAVSASTAAGSKIIGSGLAGTIVVTPQTWTISGTISPTAGGSGATVT